MTHIIDVNTSGIPVKDWAKEQVAQWLAPIFLDSEEQEVLLLVQKHSIDGAALLELTEEDMKNEMNISLGTRRRLIRALCNIEGSAAYMSTRELSSLV